MIPRDGITIIATGPLTSDALTFEIMKLTGDDQLYFYDAIAPIIAADSIDFGSGCRCAVITVRVDHRSIARSVLGCEQHTSTLPSAGDSSGSGK